MTIKIQNGGRTYELKTYLSEIKIYSDRLNSINLRLIDTCGNESLTYLSLKEAIELKNALNNAIQNA